MQESTLRNINYGDRDSLGLFQQRPSQGWGTPAQVLDPVYSTKTFLDRLLAVPGWERLPVTVAAQTVQRSAFPDAYAKWEGLAADLVRQLADVPDPAGCGPNTATLPEGVARSAIRFALAELGKPYVWGATGPNTYDCSGLILRAFQASGIDLPRVSRQQFTAGGHVPVKDARPVPARVAGAGLPRPSCSGRHRRPSGGPAVVGPVDAAALAAGVRGAAGRPARHLRRASLAGLPGRAEPVGTPRRPRRGAAPRGRVRRRPRRRRDIGVPRRHRPPRRRPGAPPGARPHRRPAAASIPVSARVSRSDRPCCAFRQDAPRPRPVEMRHTACWNGGLAHRGAEHRGGFARWMGQTSLAVRAQGRVY